MREHPSQLMEATSQTHHDEGSFELTPSSIPKGALKRAQAKCQAQMDALFLTMVHEAQPSPSSSSLRTILLISHEPTNIVPAKKMINGA